VRFLLSFSSLYALSHLLASSFFLFTPPSPTAIYPLSLHDALPICLSSVSTLILVASISPAVSSDASSASRPSSLSWAFRRRSASSERLGNVLPRHCHKTVRNL